MEGSPLRLITATRQKNADCVPSLRQSDAWEVIGRLSPIQVEYERRRAIAEAQRADLLAKATRDVRRLMSGCPPEYLVDRVYEWAFGRWKLGERHTRDIGNIRLLTWNPRVATRTLDQVIRARLFAALRRVVEHWIVRPFEPRMFSLQEWDQDRPPSSEDMSRAARDGRLYQRASVERLPGSCVSQWTHEATLPLDVLYSREQFDKTVRRIVERDLTPREVEVLEVYADRTPESAHKRSYRLTASVVGLSERQVQRLIQRVRAKLEPCRRELGYAV